MAIRGGPDIIEDGLLFHVDAADTNSYPGTGNTWYDLSGNGCHFTLVNSPSVVDKYFDMSTNEYAYVDNTVHTQLQVENTSFSTEIVYRFADTNYRQMFFGNGQYGGGGWNIGVGYSTFAHIFSGKYSYNDCTEGVNCQYNRGNIDIGVSSLNATNFFHFLVTYEYNSATSAVSKLYINGELINTATNSKAGIRAGPAQIRIALNTQGGWGSKKGYCGLARMYSTVLSAEDALQNYNATKGRYGL